MSKVTLKTAVEITEKSESTLRRDMRSGKVSYSKDDRGRVKFDTAELTRVYGELKPVDTATDTSNDKEMNGHDTHRVIALLEKQLENATNENTRLLDLADRLQQHNDRLQKQNETLMLPPPEKKQGFFSFLRRRRG